MGIKRNDWESIGDYVSKIKSEGLSYAEGAKRFGIDVSAIYNYNKKIKNRSSKRLRSKAKQMEELGDYVKQIRELGLSYIEGAERFGLNVNKIYKYNSKKRKRIKEKKDRESLVSVSVSGTGTGASAVACTGSGDVSDICTNDKGVRVSGSDSVKVKDDGVEVECASAGPLRCLDDAYTGLPPGVEELIVNYRRKNPDFGYKRIEDYLKSKYFVIVPRKKIREALKLHGLTGSVDSSFDKDKDKAAKSAKGSRRFEATYPRELYQMDVTYIYLSEGIYYLVIILDDYSRFCVCSELRRDQQGLTMIEVLHRAIERYGKPTKLLTDQGTNFYSWSRDQSLFSRYLDDMKIEHIVADPHSPQTLGKVERLNQTFQRELLKKVHFLSYQEAIDSICDYFHHYNYDRPHQGIGGSFPASRFHGVIGETSRIESKLCSHGLDFSSGYLVFKMFEHTISIVCGSMGLQVFLDGDLLECGKEKEKRDYSRSPAADKMNMNIKSKSK